MTPLQALAREAGIAVHWTDADRRRRLVSPDSLRAILSALGLCAATARDIADSRAALAKRSRTRPLRVAQVASEFPARGRRLRLLAEDGGAHELPVVEGRARAMLQPGYYQSADSAERLAVTPARAFGLDAKYWGVAAQLYALRGPPDFGDFGALEALAKQAAGAGADAIMLSPVHALPPGGISPYSPSSRRFLNPLYSPHGGKDTGNALIDWPVATRRRLHALRRAFAKFEAKGDYGEFDAFIRVGGATLLHHARTQAGGPADFRFQLYLQWQADRALATAQAQTRASGMAIGLICDVAVGVDPSGSDAFGNPGMLQGLRIGAPPDAFNSSGQNWGLTTFSPDGLLSGGFEDFLAMLRSAMRHAGGIRLDHAMSLMRLWVVPEGGRAGDGTYLHYPFQDLLGLLCLESQRHHAVVVAEDLGTVPHQFRNRIRRAGLMGMDILWFARDGRGRFVPPARWRPGSAALTSTHDLPTLAGWWRGHDLQWQEKITGRTQARARKARLIARRRLWKMLRPKGSKSAIPDTKTFIDAALSAVCAAPSALVLVPMEDLTGALEQPNIPGTTEVHPNWRRRLKSANPFASPAVRRRAVFLKRTP